MSRVETQVREDGIWLLFLDGDNFVHAMIRLDKLRLGMKHDSLAMKGLKDWGQSIRKEARG